MIAKRDLRRLKGDGNENVALRKFLRGKVSDSLL